MRTALAVAALTALVACEPTVPDSGAGVGFSDYGTYEAERALREAELTRSQTQIAPETPSSSVISSEELAAAGLPAATTTATASTVPVTAATSATASSTASTAAVSVNNPGISDEQDFQAVSSRETIESDRERIEQNAAAYTVIQPTAVPDRPNGSSDPNIAAFALSTTNVVGQKLYSRSTLNAQSKYQRACASYASSDLAQIEFLKNGGPQKDRKGVDPDGDGFACAWDPTPFRLAENGG